MWWSLNLRRFIIFNHERHSRRSYQEQHSRSVWEPSRPVGCSRRQPEQKESCRLTRCLAAFMLAELGDPDDVAAAQGVTDGTGDNGIDAVFYDALEKNCILVQSKW